jgi:hypothetical protein
MDQYQGIRIAGREELDGLSLPSEVQLALEDLAGSVREVCSSSRSASG